MTTDTIFQSSDLAQRRVEFLDAARSGLARLRDKDGMSLVMLPESRLTLLEALARWNNAHLRLERLLSRVVQPTVTDLGELAWLRVFESSDLRAFLDELYDALVAAHADEDIRPLSECLGAWRITARQLEDPLRRQVLLSDPETDDLVEAEPPENDQRISTPSTCEETHRSS